jgi:hypothetical protein
MPVRDGCGTGTPNEGSKAVLRPRLESALAAIFAALALLTLVTPHWIEDITRLEPDGGDGGAEWFVVVALGVIALGLGLLARRDYLQARSRSLALAATTSGEGPR